MQVKAAVSCWDANGKYWAAGEEGDYKGPKNEHLQSAKKVKADAEEQAANAEEKDAES